MKIEQFEGRTPRLRLEDYFSQEIMAWGLFEDIFGTLRRQFKVAIHGDFNGQVLTLDEHFIYDDGETDFRHWKIYPKADGYYTGEAEDVIGEAFGRVSGNAFHWQYAMRLKVGKGHLKVKFDDWMFLQSDKVLINRAKVKRWGIPLGTVTLVFKPAQRELG